MKRAFIILLVSLAFAACDSPEPLRVATFNIEQYPKSPGQGAKAFAAIEGLEASVVAVQEITDPRAFAREAASRLGPQWKFVASKSGPEQRLGVLYDSSAMTLLSTREHSETIIYPAAQPALEVRLQPDGGEPLRIIVLHLKAGGKFYALRAGQWWALLPVVDRAVDSGEDVIILGDFNSTSWADRWTHFGYSLWTGTRWLSRNVECTSYWEREEDCVGTPLDHALSTRPGRATAHGACADVGCDQSDSCPVWVDEVSDHCPVVFELE